MSDPLNPLQEKLKKARLYLVTDQELSIDRPTVEVAESALKGGVDIVQLREYSLADRELLEMAKHLRKLTDAHHALLIVNNRPDIALLADADGVHLGQDDLSAGEARKILGDGKLIGISTHNMDQARWAVQDGADYIGVGPVYPTQTKKNVVAPVTLKYVREVVEAGFLIPFFAIGGVKLHNLDEVMAAGARRVAVVTGLVAAANVEKVAADFKEKLAKYPL
jgi:thiamine-phosphate pyrophosphorylase